MQTNKPSIFFRHIAMNHPPYRVRSLAVFVLAYLIAVVPLAANETKKADLLLVNGTFLCCDDAMTVAQAVAVSQGRIIGIGDRKSLEAMMNDQTKVVDLNGAFVTPGFCDSHLHFVGLGESLQRVDLRNARSWEEVVELVVKQAEQLPAGTWIEGRGWHQSKWTSKPTPNVEGYPLHDLLSQRVPKHPVLLTHASGHACLANAAAMERANVTPDSESPEGGEILKDADGQPIGVFRENAQRIISTAAARSSADTTAAIREERIRKAVDLASSECLKHGITSVHDAGSTFELARDFEKLARENSLGVRVYMMIREGSGALLQKMPKEPILGVGDGFFTVHSVKVSIDGALGPHGAWLLDPYDDLPTSVGLNTVEIDELERIATLCKNRKWQLCVHAIGDRANRETLNVFEKILGKNASDHRWRIEHAQHIHPNDLPRFAALGVIPAMQGNHCTSDAIFVAERLGMRRASEGAYPWRSLIDSGCIIPNGTDAPVELVDPRPSLYASVTRKQPNGVAFFPEQCMSRRETLLSYTLWPAIASFQESDVGSIALGKQADLAVWDTNLLDCDPEKILSAQVLSTWLNGQQVFPAR